MSTNAYCPATERLRVGSHLVGCSRSRSFAAVRLRIFSTCVRVRCSTSMPNGGGKGLDEWAYHIFDLVRFGQDVVHSRSQHGVLNETISCPNDGRPSPSQLTCCSPLTLAETPRIGMFSNLPSFSSLRIACVAALPSMTCRVTLAGIDGIKRDVDFNLPASPDPSVRCQKLPFLARMALVPSA